MTCWGWKSPWQNEHVITKENAHFPSLPYYSFVLDGLPGSRLPGLQNLASYSTSRLSIANLLSWAPLQPVLFVIYNAWRTSLTCKLLRRNAPQNHTLSLTNPVQAPNPNPNHNCAAILVVCLPTSTRQISCMFLLLYHPHLPPALPCFFTFTPFRCCKNLSKRLRALFVRNYQTENYFAFNIRIPCTL